MIDPGRIAVEPSIRVGVKLQERQSPEFFRVSLEQGIGNEMISAERKHGHVFAKNSAYMTVCGCRKILDSRMVETEVAYIRNFQFR